MVRYITLFLLITAQIQLFAYYGESCGFKVELFNPEISNQRINNNQFYDSQNDTNKTLPSITLSYDIQSATSSYYTIKAYPLGKQDNTLLPDLPKIGVWMQFSSSFLIKGLEKIGEPYQGEPLPRYIPAAWLYWVGNNKAIVQTYSQPTSHILEPINFIFLANAVTKEQANKKLNNLLNSMSYTIGEGSTNVYAGLFSRPESDKLAYIKQLPGTYVSDNTNDHPRSHFRLLGPYQGDDNWYIYSASVSMESPFYQRQNSSTDNQDMLFNCGHMYVSFHRAKQQLALNIVKFRKNVSNLDMEFLELYLVDLHNSIPLSVAS